MRWLGIDVAVAKPVVIAWIDDKDGIGWESLRVSPLRGSDRLQDIYDWVFAAVRAMPLDTTIAHTVVEIPWGKTSNFDLLCSAGIAGAAVSAAAWRRPVEHLPTQTWKKESVGKGNASKAQVLKHSRLLGYRGGDQDVADALAMAQVARQRWERAVAAPPALSA